MTFPETLRAARLQLALSQAELAARLTVCPQSLSNWETGRNVPWPKEQARVLGLLVALHLKPQRPRVVDRI